MHVGPLYFLILVFIFVSQMVKKLPLSLSKQITKTTNTLKVSVEKYNDSLTSWHDRVQGLFSCLDFENVKDP